MNYLRLGFTETMLLFFYYLDTLNIDMKYEITLKKIKNQKSFCNYLYTTSGFYDKTIEGSYFDFNFEEIQKSTVYNKYFEKLLHMIKSDKIRLTLSFDKLDNELLDYKKQFINFIDNNFNINNFDINNIVFNNDCEKYDMLKFIDNKSVLIINNLSNLIKQQYESGNINKICPTFPNIKKMSFYQNDCTFFNNGPDNSIIETAEKICNNIKDIDFDCAIISAGAYSSLLFDYIVNHLNKRVYTIGGDLSLYFGIKTKRIEKFNKDKINDYFISIPIKMRPLNYEKIEDGCYW